MRKYVELQQGITPYYGNLNNTPVYVPLTIKTSKVSIETRSDKVSIETRSDKVSIEYAEINLPISSITWVINAPISTKVVLVPLSECCIHEVETKLISLGGQSLEVAKSGAQVTCISIGANLMHDRNYLNIELKPTAYDKPIEIKQCKEIPLNKTVLIPLLKSLGYNIHSHCHIKNPAHLEHVLKALGWNL